MEPNIGNVVRDFRLQNRMTLEDLANGAGLSKSYLSKIERGQKLPAISTLSNIARILKVDIATFFNTGAEKPRITHDKAGERNRIRGERYAYEILADHFHDKAIEPFIIILPPGTKGQPMVSHEGQEMVYVLKGQILFFYGEKKYLCNVGDCLYFDSSQEHRGKCLGTEEAHVMCILAYDSFRGERKMLTRLRAVQIYDKNEMK